MEGKWLGEGWGGGVSDGWWFLLLWLVGSVAIYTVYTIYTAPSPRSSEGLKTRNKHAFSCSLTNNVFTRVEQERSGAT